MEALRETHGVDVVLGSLRILAIRSGSRPESQPLSREISALYARVAEKRDVWEAARDERMAATAEIGYRDALVDGSVMTLSRQCLALVNGKTDDPRYRTLFPSAPSDRLKPIGGADQENYVRGVLLALDGAGYEALAPFKAPIEEASDNLAAAIVRRNKLQVAEDVAANALVIELGLARDAYNQAWHQLNVVFPKDKALVESFFRALTTRDKGRDPATPVNPA